MDRQRSHILLQYYCRLKGLTLAELARVIGYHPATLSKWGKIGLRIKPTTGDLDAIAVALDLDTFQLKELYDCFDYHFPRQRVVPDHYWGQAGAAPQTYQDAADVLALLPDHMLFLTDIRAFGGVVIGWVLGTAVTATQRIQFMARIPPGTCVDYDPLLCQVNGELEWVAEFGDPTQSGRLSRFSVTSECQFSGPKITVYWTPCDPNP